MVELNKRDKKRVGDARERLLIVAEQLFGEQGIQGASIRDIAAAAGIRAASVYHHFGSKDDLLWCVWERGGTSLRQHVESTINDIECPWGKLRAACEAHVVGLLDWGPANQLVFIVPPWQYPEKLKNKIVKLRDEYEQLFVSLIDDLPIPDHINRQYLRLALLGALSWPIYWYDKSKGCPAEFARDVLQMFRFGVG